MSRIVTNVIGATPQLDLPPARGLEGGRLSEAADEAGLGAAVGVVRDPIRGLSVPPPHHLHPPMRVVRPEDEGAYSIEVGCDETGAAGEAPFDIPSAGSSDTTDLAGLIEREALAFARKGTPLALLIAETLDDLASRVRFTGARSVTEYRERIELLDEWADAEMHLQSPQGFDQFLPPLFPDRSF
ncbi:hypothetical protein Isop_0387 [Isosphaera pallida ATCC 43644]|uniref:Uncharacterized protein n=1 Tax=Isosphaera pallida (strain ATCC 43644 / DSM 9630 / IS1B) TaxID=575540 RepID=E8QY03_ISOPI|nr:hypothetical protein [Isosphaera pallida]ADV60982.1 hypothetical protein Isop_0387 [Isosphaera pallida ATCC 43644]